MTEPELAKIEQEALKALQATFGIRARNLPKAMKRAGRRLPREAHRAAGVLGQAQQHTAHPKLARLIDETSVMAAHATLLRHIGTIDPKKRRTDAILSMLGAQAFNVIAVFALLIGVLIWRGFL